MILARKRRAGSPTDAQLTECAALRAQGLTWTACEQELRFKTGTLRQAMLRLGLDPMGGASATRGIHTKAVMDKCVELRAKGHSWAECGRILGVNWSSLRDKLYRHGIKLGGKAGRTPHITAEMMASGAELHNAGHSWAECGELLGINGQSLRLAMVRNGVKVMPHRVGAKTIATPELKAKARELRAQGVCWKLIERQLGVSWGTLSSAIRREDQQQKQS